MKTPSFPATAAHAARFRRRVLTLGSLLCGVWGLPLLGEEPPTYYVNLTNPAPALPYTNWATAATNIQDALNAGAQAGRLVLVTNGVYQTDVVLANGANRVALTNVTLRSVSGPAATVIDGGGVVRCAYLGTNAVLSGFTLRNGSALGQSGAEGHGGAAYCEASGTLTDCLLSGNSASYGGGACGGTLKNCTLTGNSASDGGGAYRSTLSHCRLTDNSAFIAGGVYASSLENCVLTGNAAWGGILAHFPPVGGGGAYASVLRNCVLSGNTSATWGGGASGGLLFNCTVTGNSAYLHHDSGVSGYGGGVSGKSRWEYNPWMHLPYLVWEEAWLFNCTLTGNAAGETGGATYACRLSNCIVYFNTAGSGSANYSEASDILDHSCATPLPAGPGNLDTDPRFVCAAGGDFRLRPDSPCIDVGTNLVNLLTTDLGGHPRPLDGNGDGLARFDIGAHELDPNDPFITQVTLTPSGLRLDWTPATPTPRLQWAPTITSPVWQDVRGSEGTNTITVPVVNATEFFRLIKL